MYRYLGFGQVTTPHNDTRQVLEQLRERVRLLHCSAQTEASHLRWARAFLRWQRAQQHAQGQAWPLHECGPMEVNAFLAVLAQRPRLSPASHRQALQALLFMFRQLWGRDLLDAD